MMKQKENAITYFDNSATSWPKPPEVAEAMTHFVSEIGANPGRSGHRLAVDASRVVFDAREKICTLFNAPDPTRVVFTLNITEAINLILHGLLKPDDHVITSGLEHNAVMRPLRAIERQGAEVTVLPCSKQGFLNPQSVENAVQKNTRLVVINHSSNVIGTLLPIDEIGAITRKHGILFLVDTAQTGGALPVDMQASNIDFLAFTGHKALLGPMGTGGVIIDQQVNPDSIASLVQGGTGSRSQEESQPSFMPDKFESGTQNAVGLAGLGASIQFILNYGINKIRQHEMDLVGHLIEGLESIPEVIVYGPHEPQRQTATLSFNITGYPPSTAGLILDETYGILSRVGLHCAPAAHKTIGTFPTGTIRFGLGIFNTHEEVDAAIKGVAKIAKDFK